MEKKNKIILIIQARLGSKRLPKKVLKKISRKSILDIIIDRVKKIEPIDEFWIATTKNKLDDKIESLFISFYHRTHNE